MRYKLYQLKESALHKYGFMKYEFALKNNFQISDYDLVWEGDIEANDEDIDFVLEDLFVMFNTTRTEGYEGRSLSVSDIVEMNGIKYYCNPFGWEKVND